MTLMALDEPSTLSVASVSRALGSGEGIMTHVRTALYFGIFGGCLAYVLILTFPWRTLMRNRSMLTVVAPLTSMTSLFLTWRLILLFFVAFTTHHRGHPDPPNLFVEAYVLVCDSAAGWWWSSVLLCWVTVACPVAHAEAIRLRLLPRAALAYVACAFLGAVSLAFPLFFTHLDTLASLPKHNENIRRRGNAVGGGSTSKTPQSSAATLWGACTTMAFLSTILLPLSVRAMRPVFIVALAVVHVVLAIPFAFSEAKALSPTALRRLATACAVYYVYTTCVACIELHGPISAPKQSFASSVVATFTKLLSAASRNSCQASISIDAVFSSITGLAFICLSARGSGEVRVALRSCLLTPIIGPGAALALYSAWRMEQEGAMLKRK